MILYAVAAEQSLGRLFLAGIGPGLLLVACSPPMRCFRFRQEYAAAKKAPRGRRRRLADPRRRTSTAREKLEIAAAGPALRRSSSPA